MSQMFGVIHAVGRPVTFSSTSALGIYVQIRRSCEYFLTLKPVVWVLKSAQNMFGLKNKKKISFHYAFLSRGLCEKYRNLISWSHMCLYRSAPILLPSKLTRMRNYPRV